MSKRAIILAGGRGTRLRPYTVVLPKPLMPIGEYPILEVIVKQLVAAGFTHITLAVNHQAEIIKAFFRDGANWGITIDYSLENQPLGTMGPLSLIDDLPEHFLVMNGDVLTDLNYASFYDGHVTNESIFTISSSVREHMVDYGVLESNSDDQLTGFCEKPRSTYEVSMGVYMCSRRVKDFVQPNQVYGFDNLMTDLIKLNERVKVVRHKGYWLDIGRHDDYEQAINEFDSMRSKFIND